MRVFNDYDFLAKYVKPLKEVPAHLRLTAFVANELDVRSVLDIGGGSTSYLHLLKNVCNTAVVDMSAESLQKVVAEKKMVGMLPDLGIKEKYEFVSALEVLEHLNPDDYEDSLHEIDRVSSRYVFLTSPFLQDLRAAYVLCDNCGSEFQAEGHYRSFNLENVFGLQQYFGGLKDIYFCAPSQGKYVPFAIKTSLKKMTRIILQRFARAKYCCPPFTKCPECGNEIFNNYDDYLNRGVSEKNDREWWRWDDLRVVSSRFGALYDKNVLHKKG